MISDCDTCLKLPYELIVQIVENIQTFKELLPLTNIPFFRDIISKLVFAIDLDCGNDSSIISKYTTSVVYDIPRVIPPGFKFVMFKYSFSEHENRLREHIGKFLDIENLPASNVMCIFKRDYGCSSYGSVMNDLFIRPYELYLTDTYPKIYIDEISNCILYLNGQQDLELRGVDMENPPTIISNSVQKVKLVLDQVSIAPLFDRFDMPNLNQLNLGTFPAKFVSALSHIPSTVEMLQICPRMSAGHYDFEMPDLPSIKILDIWLLSDHATGRKHPIDRLKIPSNVWKLKLDGGRPLEVTGTENIMVMETYPWSMPFAKFPNLRLLWLYGNEGGSHIKHLRKIEGDYIKKVPLIDAPKLEHLHIASLNNLVTKTTANNLTSLTLSSSVDSVEGIPLEHVKKLTIKNAKFKNLEYERFKSLEDLTLLQCQLDQVELHRFPNVSKLTVIDCRIGAGFTSDYMFGCETPALNEWKASWSQQSYLKELDIAYCRDRTVAKKLLQVWPVIEELSVDIYTDDRYDELRDCLLKFPLVTRRMNLTCFSVYWFNAFKDGLLKSSAPIINVSQCLNLGRGNDEIPALLLSPFTKEVIVEKGVKNASKIYAFNWNDDDNIYTLANDSPKITQGEFLCERMMERCDDMYYYRKYSNL